MFNKILFGKDKKGGFKVWSICAQPCGHSAIITILHGKEGGKMQEKVESVQVGKQGRTPLEQAISQAEGKIKKQIDKGYRESKSELEELPLLAMLATDYRKQGHRIEYPCFTSVKYDGVRCLAKCKGGVITLESRTGQPYDVPHIVEALSFMRDGEVLDGELYFHGAILQDITSAVKRTDARGEIEVCERKVEKAKKGGDEEEIAEAVTELNHAIYIGQLRPLLEFHVFDVPSEHDYATRLNVLQITAMDVQAAGTEYVRIAEHNLAVDEEDMKAQHKAAVAAGYEGIMLRNAKGVYESGKRSADLQKYKEFMDAEFKILDIIEDKDGHGVFVCQNDVTEHSFTVVMGSHADRIYQLANREQFVGEWLTVKFQSRYKGTLLPQFPTGVQLRACDEHGNPIE